METGPLLFISLTDFKACRLDEFTCYNNQCISGNLRCDGKFDCNDHTDENNCGKILSRKHTMATNSDLTAINVMEF